MPKKKDEKSKSGDKEVEAKEGDEGEQVLDEGSGSIEPTEKEKLLALYQTLKDLGINSISDLEVKISRL